MKNYDTTKEYIQYIEDVISGKQVACKWIKLACEKSKSWFSRDDIEFRYEKVDYIIKFIESLKQYKDQFKGKPLLLQPWQKWCIAEIFGWYYKGTEKRVTKKVLLFCARKTGKTIFSAAIALAMLIIEGGYGAEILNVANNTKQASILLDMEKILLKSLDSKSKYFRVNRDKIVFKKRNSYSQVMSSDASGLDGFGGHFICDETHEYRDSKLWDVLISGQGALLNPLAINITTAGFRLDGFLYNYTNVCKEVLQGLKTDDSQFSAIFTLDEDDDWTDENVWVKANPNMNVSVSIDYLREQVQNAINNSSLEVGVKTKNFNLFCQSSDIWLRDELIQSISDNIDLEKLKGEVCYGGIDLSSVSDLSCFTLLFPPNQDREYYPDKYLFKTWYYIPKDTLEKSPNKELYKQWKREGYINTTSGDYIDYDFILKDLNIVLKDLLPEVIGYDPYNSTQFVNEAEAIGIPMGEFGQNLGNFNKPTKLFEILAKKKDVVLDNNPCTRFCFKNAELKFDRNENCKPVKANGDNNNKIDGTISIIESLGCYVANPDLGFI